MERFYVSLLCSFVLLLSFSLHFFLFKNRSGLSGQLPTGKTGWPMIGESLEFLSCGWKGFPEKFVFDRMAKYSSIVFKTHLFGEKVAVFCGAPGHKFLFSNENKLVQAWWPSSIDKLFPSSGSSMQEEAMRVKNMALACLKPEALQRYIGVMDSITGRHFYSDWESKDEVKVLSLCKACFFSIAAKLFVSVEDPNEVEKLLKPFNLFASGLFSVPIDLPGTPFNRAIKASKELRKMFSDIIKQRKMDLGEGKASATQDIMSHMLTTSDENGKLLSETEITNTIIGLLLGGHDTTTSACAFMVKYLAELPEIYEQVYKEQMEIVYSKGPGELLNWADLQKMKYSWNVACEVLRLSPPLQGSFREAVTDFMFKGFSIPKGWKLYWSAYTTHKNAEYFPEPEIFNPARFEGTGPAPYTYIPFGGGSRLCPGKGYARLVILIFVHHLMKRFRFEKVIPDEKIVVDPNPIPAKGLPVRLYPHAA